LFKRLAEFRDRFVECSQELRAKSRLVKSAFTLDPFAAALKMAGE
jgi:hypothetical protein